MVTAETVGGSRGWLLSMLCSQWFYLHGHRRLLKEQSRSRHVNECMIDKAGRMFACYCTHTYLLNNMVQ